MLHFYSRETPYLAAMISNGVGFLKGLSAQNCSSKIFSLELDAKILKGDQEAADVHIIYEEFDIEDESDKTYIKNTLKFCMFGLRLLESEINSSIFDFLKERKLTNEFGLSSITTELSTIYFSIDYPFGCFHLTYRSSIDIEHGIGVLVKNFRPFRVGYADIRFDEDSLDL